MKNQFGQNEAVQRYTMTESQLPWAPIPHTAISALAGSGKPFDAVYYQGLDGNVYRYNLVLKRQDHVVNPEPEPIKLGKPGTLAPLAVQHNVNLSRVEAYFLDKNAILRQAKVLDDQEIGIVDLQVLDWLNIQADNFGKVACLSAPFQAGTWPRGGSWLYYQSGTQKAIREIWDRTPPPPQGTMKFQPLERASRDLRFTSFSANDILLGTSIAATIVTVTEADGSLRDLGSFYYQRDNGAIHRNFWHNRWIETIVVPPGEHGAVFHTGLAVTFSQERKKEYLFYVTPTGQLRMKIINIKNGHAEPGQICPCECSPLLPGTSLSCTIHEDGGFVLLRVYYQNPTGAICVHEIPDPEKQ